MEPGRRPGLCEILTPLGVRGRGEPCGSPCARAAAAAFLLLAFAATAHAQVTTGTIYGRVVDASEVVVPGANVTATNVLTTSTKATITNKLGQFTIPFLTVGTYTVTIEAPGFKTRVEEGLEISSGREITMTSAISINGLPARGLTFTVDGVTSPTPSNTVKPHRELDKIVCGPSGQPTDLPPESRGEGRNPQS